MSDETTRMYSNGEVVVVWEPGKCQHSGNCSKGLPKVFNSKKHPWIQLEHATSAQIIAQVKQCPSGALSIEGLKEEPKAEDPGQATAAETAAEPPGDWDDKTPPN